MGTPDSIHQFSANGIDGKNRSMEEFTGKVLLIVNTASECGFTSQYQGLQEIYQKYQGQGFSVLGFPCNQFGHQEPGSEKEIAQFCQDRFSVSFPLFQKVDVNGDGAIPLFQFLKKKAPGLLGTEAIKWNFTKFLIDRQGQVIKRFAPQDKPEDLGPEIEKYL